MHAEDLQGCLESFVSSFNESRALPREYRLRRADGEHRWILDKGIPRYTHEGEFAGYIGSCVERAMGAVRELLRRRKDGSEVPIEIGFNRVHTSRAWHLWPTGNRGGEQTRVLLRKGKTQLESLDINALVNGLKCFKEPQSQSRSPLVGYGLPAV